MKEDEGESQARLGKEVDKTVTSRKDGCWREKLRKGAKEAGEKEQSQEKAEGIGGVRDQK